jgi:hypothetical protein
VCIVFSLIIIVILGSVAAGEVKRPRFILPDVSHYEFELPASPLKQKAYRRQPDSANSEEHGTEQVPLVVKVIPPEATPEAKKREEDKSEQDRKLADYTAYLFYATGFLGLSTAGLAIVAYCQMREARGSIDAAKRAADTAERALTVVERAFCSISNISNYTISIRGELSFFSVRLHVANSGRTAAINYAAFTNVVAIGMIPDDFRFPDARNQTEGFSVVSPRSETYLPAIIPIQDAIAAYERRKRILVYGWIEYDDVFENSPRHRIEFCLELEFTIDPRTFPQFETGQPRIPVFNIKPYGGYNNYDDGCLYKPGQTPRAAPGELPEPTIPPHVNYAPA